MTTNVYRDLGIDQYTGSAAYAVATGSGINTGDMCQWDTGSRIATLMQAASGAIFLGVANSSQPLAGLGTVSVPLTNDRVTIKGQGVFDLKTTTGETYSHLDPVFMGADQQTVSKVGSSRMVGRIWLPDGTQVTGAAGTNVHVMIYGQMALPSVLPSAASTAL